MLLGIPFLSARFETGDARTLPRSSEARATALALADRFPARGTDPVTVIADVDPTDPAATDVGDRHRQHAPASSAPSSGPAPLPA